MNEAVTKRFLLYFRLMLLVWILIVNSILHVVGFEYSWLIFLSNIMLFTMEGDIKDRFVSVELGGLVGMVFTVIALLAITFLTPVLGSFFGFLIPLAVVLFVLIILHPYAPKVLNNVGFAYLTVACIDAEAVAANLPRFFFVYIVGSLVFNGVCILLSKCTGHSCLQSNHVCFSFCRSDIGMLTTKVKVYSSCRGILDRLSDDIYQIAACRASSSFNNSYSTVKIAKSSIRQIEALRIEMVAGNYRSTYRKIILSRN